MKNCITHAVKGNKRHFDETMEAIKEKKGIYETNMECRGRKALMKTKQKKIDFLLRLSNI